MTRLHHGAVDTFYFGIESLSTIGERRYASVKAQHGRFIGARRSDDSLRQRAQRRIGSAGARRWMLRNIVTAEGRAGFSFRLHHMLDENSRLCWMSAKDLKDRLEARCRDDRACCCCGANVHDRKSHEHPQVGVRHRDVGMSLGIPDGGQSQGSLQPVPLYFRRLVHRFDTRLTTFFVEVLRPC